MSKITKKAAKIANVAVICTCGMHPFCLCCGAPLIAAVAGTGAASSLTGWLPEWLSPWLLPFSAVALGISWIFYLSGHGGRRWLMWLATGVFIISLSIQLVMPHIVATHTHPHDHIHHDHHSHH
ncbi:MAG: hypothetical protein LBB23_03655 [Rickettsiales bacterium]|nr:hypothetical protein [Rickettsiales bacterium]